MAHWGQDSGFVLEREEFLSVLADQPADELAAYYLARDEAVAFDSPEAYIAFKNLIHTEVGQIQSIAVVGTGNWRFSLNPEKNFKAFDEKSDLDIAIVSVELFTSTWQELRRIHRSDWYGMARYLQNKLRRYGENVYCGFVSPTWIPRNNSDVKYQYKSMLNRLSNKSPGQREVKMMYFKDHAEAIDYYKRGFEIAKRTVSST